MLVMLCYGFCMNKTTISDPVVQQDCCECIVYDLFGSFSNIKFIMKIDKFHSII